MSSLQRLAALCISKRAIAALVTSDSVAQLYKGAGMSARSYGIESYHRLVDNYILFSDPQFSVQNQIPETLGFKVLRGCGKLIFIIYSLSKSYVLLI